MARLEFLRLLALGGLVACDTESSPELEQPVEAPAPAEGSTEFSRTHIYSWPGQSTVVWYIDGGLLDGLPTLLLSEARFSVQDGEHALLPATLEILTLQDDGEWKPQTLTDREGAVFHKAVLHDSGILTISGGGPGSGQPAMFKHWKRTEAGWQYKRIWAATWEGRLNRMRDFEIGDVDGDGSEEVVIGTHDHGVIAVLDGVLDDSEQSATQLAKEADRYIHEIELGDLDGDGQMEIFASRSEPNISARSQGGTVEMFRFDGQSYVQTQLWSDTSTHIKEILATDMDGDGRAELFAAIEARREGEQILDPVQVVQLQVNEKGDFDWRLLARIDDEGMRFMAAHDVDGQGAKELFLSPRDSGLYLLPWSATETRSLQQFETDSGGFEHAIRVLDIDGDGTSELYVADDLQKGVFQYRWD
jgi:hypothetical protein